MLENFRLKTVSNAAVNFERRLNLKIFWNRNLEDSFVMSPTFAYTNSNMYRSTAEIIRTLTQIMACQ